LKIFLKRIFLGRIFWVGFLGGLFLEEFYGRNYLFYFNVEGNDLFVKILFKNRRSKEGGQNLDP
jgi:hypothetical protein